MVERLLFPRDQRTLDDLHGHVGAFVEELRGGEDQHAIVLCKIEKAVLAHAGPVGDGKGDARREAFDLVGDPVAIPVRDGPHGRLAGADEDRADVIADRHVPCIRDDGVEADLEAGRQLDALQSPAQRHGALLVLRDNLQLE